MKTSPVVTAGVGTVAGAGIGYAVSLSKASKMLAANGITKGMKPEEQLDAFIKKGVETFENNFKEAQPEAASAAKTIPGQLAKEEIAKGIKEATSKSSLKEQILDRKAGINTPKIKGVSQPDVETAVKEFKEHSKEAFESFKKSVKNTKVKWIAGLAAAGLAIGTAIGLIAKHNANKKA